MLQQQYTTKVNVGESVMFKAPSGRRYNAVVLDIDNFCGEVNLLVEFNFKHNGRVIRSTGWQPMRTVADVCPGCNGMGYTSVRNGDDDQPCPICSESDEVTF